MRNWVAHMRVQVHAHCKVRITGSADASALLQIPMLYEHAECQILRGWTLRNGQSHKTLALLIWSWWVTACW